MEVTTKQRLIQAMRELARRKGFDRTSVNDVLTATGVGKGSFYHHFKDKQSLEMAVLESDRDEFMRQIDDWLDAPTPLEALDGFFLNALAKHRETEFLGGCLWGNTALEMSDSNPVFSKYVEAVFDEWIAKIANVVNAGQACGQFRSDVSAAELSRSIVALIEGGIMMSRLAKEETPMRQCLSSLRNLLVVEE